MYDDHLAQQVVMVRAADPRDNDVVAVRVVLPVRHVTATAHRLAEVLDMHVALRYPDPPRLIRLTMTPWTGSSGIDLETESGTISPVSTTIDLGVSVDLIHERARAVGLDVDGPPQNQPWYRRTCSILLPEGHRIKLDGPLRPEHAVEQD